MISSASAGVVHWATSSNCSSAAKPGETLPKKQVIVEQDEPYPAREFHAQHGTANRWMCQVLQPKDSSYCPKDGRGESRDCGLYNKLVT
jgi:hypothetical protein